MTHQPSNVVKFPPIGECDDDLWMQNDPRPNLFDQLGAESFQRESVAHYERLARQARRARFWRFGFANRSADASHSSLLRVSTIGGIAIAVFTALYFIAEFLR